MLTVLVTNIKGGCGKTTIATNLAGAFANAGYNTYLADCDRQRSSLGWGSRRPIGDKTVTTVDWVKNIGKLPPTAERVVIDAPAALRRGQADELVKIADMIILPVLPSVFDESATRRFLNTLEKLKPIRKGKRAVAVVGNRVRKRTRAAASLEFFLQGVGHESIATLRDTQLYAAVAAQGRSLFDMNTQRSANFLQDWLPLLTYVDETTVNLET